VKTIPVADVGTLKNELNKYKKGKKLTIAQFNQAARLAWLGRVVLSKLDPHDPQCGAYLLYVQPPEGVTGRIIEVEEELLAQIHILDAEQGDYLAEIFREGMQSRVQDLQALNERDFYFGKFFRPDDGKAE
jgi:hypothetical protein